MWFIFVLNWVLVTENAHAVVTWNTPTDGETISKAENTATDTVITTLAADTATTYTIVSQTPDTGTFDIPTSTDELNLIASLDYETDTAYTIVLRADDGAGHSADITYTVTVTDVNETPVFSPASASHSVESGTSSGTIYDVSQHITDPEGDAIAYSISESELSIGPNGAVSPAQTLTYDPGSPSITATVTASDGELSATFTLTIYMKTVPVFTFTNNPMDFPESSNAGDTLYTYDFTDADGDTNPTFSITDQSVAGTFQQTGNTEIVVAAGQSFDFEGDTTEYTISLQAVDASGFTGTATLTVNIINVNDEVPEFTSSADPVPVLETSTTGTTVYTVQATDDGDTLNYFIDSGSTDNDFQIADSSTGAVTVANALSFSRTSAYTLVFRASDGTQESTQTVTFNIKTVPVFTFTNNPMDFPESSNAGNTLYTYDFTDADGDTNPTFSITDQSVAGIFEQTGNTDIVVAAGQSFDFEGDTTQYTISMRAVDASGFTGTATLTVNIINVNDENPEFTSSAGPVSVPEITTTGTTVYTVQATDDGNTLNYIIDGGNTDSDFQIADSSTGAVTLANALSFSRTSVYNLVFQASDGSQQNTQTVTFNIKTIPQLTLPASNTKEIMETVSIGHTVYVFEASDDDGDTSFTYSIVDRSDASKFDVNGDSTAVLTNAEFDYETGNRTFTVTLKVSDTFPLTSTAVLTVTIVDSNDNIPEFNPTSYTASLKENLAAQSSIAQVTATDSDAEDTFTYSFSSGNDAGLFSINGDTGVVGTTGPLNFESAETISLVVAATDSGENIGSASLVVTVIQETIPVFVNPLASEGASTSLSESTAVDTIVYKLVATDADGDTLTFVFTNDNNEFDLEINQDITVAAALDYETAQTFELEFKVTDENSVVATSSATLTVNIEDVNDNPPVFSAASYSGSVLEKQTTAVTVTTVDATDADSSLNNNNVIEYSITDGNSANLFAINADTGAITATNLNHASASSHTLEVTAKDLNGAAGALEATVTVNVAVETQPAWTEPNTENKEYNVDEDIAAGYVVVQLAATDADSSGILKYSIKTQTPSTPEALFVIITDTTNLKRGSTDLDVDVENAITSVTLVLSVTDDLYTVDRTIVINIQDINDNAPVFNPSSYTPFTISENAAMGDSVGTVTATDGDLEEANSQITYSLSGTNFADFVMSTTVPGQINTATTSFTSPYKLNVTASDGTKSDTLNSITIIVKSAPAWVNPASAASVSKAEDVSSAEVFYTISATDANSDPLTYSIKGQTVSDFFTIGGTSGRDVLLNTGNALDYESTQQYTLTFIVTDGTFDPVESAELVITVTDVNDNTPTFSSENIDVVVKDTHSVGDIIKTLTATDADSSLNNNNVLTYSFHSGNDAGDFAISSSGVMTLAGSVASGSTYSIVVHAVDGGTPALTGSATLVVTTATASNPVLNALALSSTYTVTVAEDDSVGKSVYEIKASDSDGDTLLYTIKTQTPSAKFTLNNNVLEISTALDSETEASYTLVFEVDDDDGNTGNKLTSGTLIITVTDANDHYPTFPQEIYTVDIMEKRTEVVNIVKLSATDADSDKSSNGAIAYSIVDGDLFNQFTVDTNSGQLATKNVGLLRSKQKYHVLAVQAKDRGLPPRADSVHVIVNVTPFEDSGGSGNGSSNQKLCVIMSAMLLLWSLKMCLKL